MVDLASALVYYVVFLFSTTLHEAGHAWAAKLGGDLTAYHGGQVSLDPRPHIRREPFGMVILPLLTVVTSGWPMGFASAPFDPNWALRHPRRAGWMALAGPAANLILVVIAAVGLHAGMLLGVFHVPPSAGFDRLVAAGEGWGGAAFFLSVLFSMNLLLAFFNLIPLPPLDGSAAIPVFLNPQLGNSYQRFLFRNGQTFAIVGMLVAWRVLDVIFTPVFVTAIRILHWGAY
ncbi:MAG: site-2 protease family protein [Vicinamibacterales bacterium]